MESCTQALSDLALRFGEDDDEEGGMVSHHLLMLMLMLMVILMLMLMPMTVSLRCIPTQALCRVVQVSCLVTASAFQRQCCLQEHTEAVCWADRPSPHAECLRAWHWQGASASIYPLCYA